jgi:hypothetical protein
MIKDAFKLFSLPLCGLFPLCASAVLPGFR